jgi:FkbM family methyltransferase
MTWQNYLLDSGQECIFIRTWFVKVHTYMKKPSNSSGLNISFFECIKSWLYFLKRYPLYPLILINFYRAYENYITMTASFWRRKYPIRAVLRNGKDVAIRNERTLKFPWHTIPADGILHGHEFDIRLDTEKEISIISSSSMTGKITLLDSINNGDIYQIFWEDQYKMLPVDNAIVIDVGSNIADSSIYFALHGAERVIAIDPSPQNYIIAKENIILNNLSGKIIVVLAGCASKTCYSAISCSKNSTLSNQFDGTQVKVWPEMARNLEPEKFPRIKLFSLSDLLSENGINTKAVLKMDCEGCEYGVIISSPPDILKRFSHILIEYHHGYRNLRDKLLSCGFKVSISRPMYIRTHDIGRSMYAGIIFAVNNEA